MKYLGSISNNEDVATKNYVDSHAGAPTTTTATLPVNGWSSNTQSITIQGIKSSSKVMVSPNPAGLYPDSLDDYIDAGVYCLGQSANTLTFKCKTTPSEIIDLSIMYW